MKYWLLCALLLSLGGCKAQEKWIYSDTPVPSATERGGKPLVIVVGDSIAAGWGECTAKPCKGIELDWWQDAIGDKAIVLNRGIGNSTTDHVLERWEQDTKDAEIIIILIGVNDIAQNKSADHILKNLDTMHQRALDADATPIFVTIMPSDTHDTPQEIAVFQEVNAALRAKTDWLIMDISAEMEDTTSPAHLRRGEVAFEGSAHPNELGYAKMAAFVREWWESHFS